MRRKREESVVESVEASSLLSMKKELLSLEGRRIVRSSEDVNATMSRGRLFETPLRRQQ